MTMVMASMLPGPLQDEGFLLCSLLAVLQSAIVLLRLTMGMSFKRHFSFFLSPPPPRFFLGPSVHSISSVQQSSRGPSLRVCQPPRRTGPDVKMEILHSKARWSDWTRSVCLKRRNPIYVCNEVCSPRTRAMCFWWSAEDRWPVGQVLGRTPNNRMSCAVPPFGVDLNGGRLAVFSFNLLLRKNTDEHWINDK